MQMVGAGQVGVAASRELVLRAWEGEGPRLILCLCPPAVEALEHLIHQQKCFVACQMFVHPLERQHGMLQVRRGSAGRACGP